MSIDIKIRKNSLLSEDIDMFDFVNDDSFIKSHLLSSISCTSIVTYLPENTMSYRDRVIFLCTKTCIELIKNNINNYDTWILASTPSWEKDTPRFRYFKLWRIFKKRYGNSLSFNNCREEIVYTTEGVKAFGAVKLENNQLDIGIDILKSSNVGSSFIIMIPTNYDIDIYKYINYGWGFCSNYNILRFWSAIISCTCKDLGIFLRIFGEFDDKCVGVNAIMHKNIFDNYFCKIFL